MTKFRKLFNKLFKVPSPSQMMNECYSGMNKIEDFLANVLEKMYSHVFHNNLEMDIYENEEIISILVKDFNERTFSRIQKRLKEYDDLLFLQIGDLNKISIFKPFVVDNDLYIHYYLLNKELSPTFEIVIQKNRDEEIKECIKLFTSFKKESKNAQS